MDASPRPTNIRCAISMPELTLDADVLLQILTFCHAPTLAYAARTSRLLHELATPLLYRHLSLDLALPNPLVSTTIPLAAPFPDRVFPHPLAAITPSINPHLHYIQTLHISAHHRAHCAALSAIPDSPSPVSLPNLRSLHFQIDKLTYHWPHGCPLVQSLNPTPQQLILSADAGCDVLYWAFGVRFYEEIPAGVKRLVFLMKYSPGVGMQETREVRSGSAGYKPRLISSLNRIKHGNYLRCPSREIALVYDKAWRMEEGDLKTRMELELGNIAVLALLVAKKVNVYGLTGTADDGGAKDNRRKILDLVEGMIRELACGRGHDAEAEVEEAIKRVCFQQKQWINL